MKLATLHLNTERGWRGGEQQTIHLIEGLRRRGHGAVLAARPESPIARRAVDLGIDLLPVRPINEADPIAAWKLGRYLRANRPHILHMHSSHALFLGNIAALLAPGIVRVCSRRMESTIYRRFSFRLNWLKYRLGAHRILAISKAVRGRLIADGIGADRIAVVPSGVDPEQGGAGSSEASGAAGNLLRRQLGLPPEIPLLLTVGALERKKGLLFLLEALRRLRRQRDLAWIVLGEGPLAPELKRRAERLGLSDRMFLIGFREDVREYLDAASLFVLPTLSEGLGTSILEALLFQKPVVASNVGGVPEIIEDGITGLLAEPGNPDALAEAVARMLDHPEKAAGMARAGRQKILEEYTVDRMVEGTLRIYHMTLERSSNVS